LKKHYFLNNLFRKSVDIFSLNYLQKAYLSTLHFHFLCLGLCCKPSNNNLSCRKDLFPLSRGSSAPKLITFDLPDTVFYTDLFYIAAKGNHSNSKFCTIKNEQCRQGGSLEAVSEETPGTVLGRNFLN
jgi:hypothetical protein